MATGDLQNPPFPDGFYDLVICQQGLQYLPDPSAGLQQIHRVLRPAGRVVLATWSDIAKSPGHILLFQALEVRRYCEKARPVAWSLAGEAQLLELVFEGGICLGNDHDHIVANEIPSARAFVEIVLKGSSKKKRAKSWRRSRPIEKQPLSMTSLCVCVITKRATR